jgi:DNA-binding transcriptional MerR regulator
VFRIAEFARLSGVSARTLRKWDAAAVFRPAWTDPSSGYRGYSPAQLPELRRVLALRDVGVPLDEIAALVRGGDARAALERRRRDLEAARREAERRLRALDINVAMADDPAAPDVVVRPVPAELVAWIAQPVGDEPERESAAWYRLEAAVRDLGRRRAAPPGATTIDGVAAIFVPLTGRIAPIGDITAAMLPAVRVASVLHRGRYDGLASAEAALARWTREAGLRTAGPVRTLYVQFGAEAELRVPARYLVDRAADLVTELQLPVA